MKSIHPALAPLAAAALLAACATPPAGTETRTASIQRTANGVAHITAPDTETLAYGVAYAHAQDNVCQTAQQLVTARGQRSRWFGPATPGLFGRRMLPNEQADFFIAAHMDDAALAKGWAATDADVQAAARLAMPQNNTPLPSMSSPDWPLARKLRPAR